MTQALGYLDATFQTEPPANPPPGRWVHGHEVHPTNSWIGCQTVQRISTGAG